MSNWAASICGPVGVGLVTSAQPPRIKRMKIRKIIKGSRRDEPRLVGLLVPKLSLGNALVIKALLGFFVTGVTAVDLIPGCGQKANVL